MAGGGIGDVFGALGSGLAGLAGQASGGGGGGGAPDLGNAAQNAGSNNILTNPLVGADEALNPGTQLFGQNQQDQQQQPQAQALLNQSNYTPPPQQPQAPVAQAQGAMQPVQYLPPEAREAAMSGAPAPAAPQINPVQTGTQSGISAQTQTGLTPQAEIAAGYRPPEATEADLAQAAQEKQRNPAAASAVDPAKPAAPPEQQIGASSINTDQQSAEQPGQQKQPNALTAAGNVLKNIAKPGSVRDPLTAGASGGGGGGGGGGGNSGVNALAALLGLPQHLLSNLLGLTNQVGSDYGPQQYGSQGATAHGYGYGADTPPVQAADSPPSPQQPSAPQPPTVPEEAAPATAADPAAAAIAAPTAQPPTTQEAVRQIRNEMQPGSAARAIRAGYDGAAAQERPDGSRVPTNGMPGGTVPQASPPAPGLGAIPNQAKRPFHYRSKITVNGNEYDFGSGGGQFASLPYGTYNLHPKAIGSIGHRIGAISGISDSGNAGDNTVHDPLYRGSGGGHARAGVEIHPDVSGGRMKTNGCIGVARHQWGSFSRDFRAAAAKGPLTLTVGPEGASIQSAQSQMTPAAAVSSPQQLSDNQAAEMEGVVNTTAKLAPHGLPWQQYRRSQNFEDVTGQPTLSQDEARAAEVERDRARPPGRTPITAMSRAAGFGDIDPLLDELARQYAMQTMAGSVPMPRPRPRM